MVADAFAQRAAVVEEAEIARLETQKGITTLQHTLCNMLEHVSCLRL
jgi:hypothetical protein